MQSFQMPSSHYVQLRRGRMHYLDEGSGEPVLLLHGNPTWSYLYRNVIPWLCGRRRVVAPDHLGFGLSEKPEGAPYSLRWHTENLEEFVNKLELRELTVVLHDWGGPIGLGLALQDRSRVKRLVIMNTWAFRLSAQVRLPQLLELCRKPGVGEDLVLGQNLLVERGIPEGVCHPERIAGEVLAAYRAPFVSAEERRSVLAMVRDIPLGEDTDTARLIGAIQDGLADLRLPATIIWGERDPVFSTQVLALWRLYFPAAEVHLLPDASHFLQEDAPDELGRLIEAFCEATP